MWSLTKATAPCFVPFVSRFHSQKSKKNEEELQASSPAVRIHYENIMRLAVSVAVIGDSKQSDSMNTAVIRAQRECFDKKLDIKICLAFLSDLSKDLGAAEKFLNNYYMTAV